MRGATHVARWKNSRKIAFTEPSRGMSGAKVEQTSSETLSFRCVCERCHLTRGEGATHVAHWKNSRKIAFTLAEVLITLGIIGVVAALTLPSLITKFKMKGFEVAFKKQYSVLNNAINYIQVNSQLSECYVTTAYLPDGKGNLVQQYTGKNDDCSTLKTELIKNLKLQPIQKYSFTSQSKVKNEGGILVNSTVTYDSAIYYLQAYLLPDGAVVLFSTNNSGRSYYNDTIIVDVNGKKGPNKWGYDVFWLSLVSKNNVLRLNDEYASLAEKGGKLPRTILLNANENKSTGWYWER